MATHAYVKVNVQYELHEKRGDYFMAEDKIVFCLACGARNRVAAQQAHRIPKCGKCGTSLVHAPVSGKVNELADGEFSHYVDEFHLPVLVDFYSPTCGPCRMLAPVLENLAGRYASKLVFYKVDTSRQQIQASRFSYSRGAFAAFY